MIFEECVSVTKQLHQFLLVAARLQFVEERGELLVIAFLSADAPLAHRTEGVLERLVIGAARIEGLDGP